MASDPRRFDAIAKVVSDQRRQLDDTQSTLLARLAAHKHVEADVASLVTDLSNRSLVGHTHDLLDISEAVFHEARYEQHSTQSFGNATDTKIVWDTISINTADVVVSGGSTCALGRSGLWLVTAGLRYNGNAGSGERHIFIQTGTTFNTANRIASQTAVNVGSVPCTVSTATVFRATAGSSVFAAGWQNSGATIGTDVGFGGTNHITLIWLRP